MITATTETIPGREIISHLGLVCGNTVRAKHVGRDIMAGLKTLIGGEVSGYTEMLQESRNQATDRMIAQAQAMSADARCEHPFHHFASRPRHVRNACLR